VTRITAKVITVKHILINAEHLRPHAQLCFDSSYVGFFKRHFDTTKILKAKTLHTQHSNEQNDIKQMV
jgi:hypothetical protein